MPLRYCPGFRKSARPATGSQILYLVNLLGKLANSVRDRMNRRDTLVAAAALLSRCLLVIPHLAMGQQPGKVYRIGYLSTPTRGSVENGVQAFVRTLRQLGWVEGQNLIIEYRW